MIRPGKRIKLPQLIVECYVCLVFVCGCSGKVEKDHLRLLAWVGYDEPEFIAPLEQALGAEIEVTTYVGGDQMYTLFTTSPPGTYDAVVVDAEYGERMFKEGLLRQLDRETWYDSDLFDIFKDGSPAKINGEVYAAVMRWGALGLVYNYDKVSRNEVSHYSVLWSDKLKNRVVVFDWYLPVMGVLSVANGNEAPFSLTSNQFTALESSLETLRPQVATIHPGTGQVIEDLRTGAAWIGPGIGEWASAVLAEEGHPVDWVVPDEGGVMWIEGFAIPKTARNPELARKFVRLVREPTHLAHLAWRKAYHSQVVRKSAYNSLSSEQLRLLKATKASDLEDVISRLRVRRLPTGPFGEDEWVRAWQRFKTQ